MDTNHNECGGLVRSVREGDLARVRWLLEQGESVDSVDDEGSSALHLAVEHGHYNIAVLLLNKGCSLDIENQHGLTALQLANKHHETRAVFSMAIQLTKKNRFERDNVDKKRKLIISDMHSEEKEDDDVDPVVQLNNRLQSSQHNLRSAEKLVTDLETQLCSARSLVHQLQLEVDTTQTHLNRERRRKKKQERSGSEQMISRTMLESCSVCLEVPGPGVQVFQCPQGHVLCEQCKSRPELTSCPQCRVSLVNVNIRNRTLERLILLTRR